jgi:phage recombination protein Bet
MPTAEIALPTSGDQSQWNDQERALVEAAGLTRVTNRSTGATALADRPTVEAFLQHCRRTGLDPIARQIYAIYRGGKWGIQISIDGARLVAERTRQYEGQTPVEWTGDGVTWTQVWLSPEPPAAARVGVFRTGFREPLFAVATWDSYVVMEDEWEGPSGNRHKTGEQVVSSMWRKFGPLMLGKCAEMLALRKAFPQDLSGLYSTEEMQQADKAAPEPSAPQIAAEPAPEHAPEPSRDWLALARSCRDRVELRALYGAAEAAEELGLRIVSEPGQPTVKQVLWTIREGLPEVFEEVVDAEVVDEVGASDEPTGQVTEWAVTEPGAGGREIDPETGEELI